MTGTQSDQAIDGFRGSKGDGRLPAKKSVGGELVGPIPLHHVGKIRLNDVENIRLEMARVYKDMRVGRIHAQDGTRLAYVLDMVRKAHETCGLQRRVEVTVNLLSPQSSGCKVDLMIVRVK